MRDYILEVLTEEYKSENEVVDPEFDEVLNDIEIELDDYEEEIEDDEEEEIEEETSEDDDVSQRMSSLKLAEELFSYLK
jgi:hypothetical protein